MTSLTVPARFNGPATSGNGGWSAGAIAALLDPDRTADWPAVTVSLRQPPPLDAALPVSEHDGWLVAATDTTSDAAPVLRARLAADAGQPEPRPVEPVPLADARLAEQHFPGLSGHPFPTCVVCGVDREPGDGLRVFPGRVTPVPRDGVDLDRSAATWTPSASQAGLACAWAATDCIGAWTADIGERLMVLGQMTARVHRLPVVGDEHVVVGLTRGQEGRKTFTSASLYDSAGNLVVAAEHLWIAVERSAFA